MQTSPAHADKTRHSNIPGSAAKREGTQGTFSSWPLRPPVPLTSQADSLALLQH